jgi:hypothetical protein
VDPKIKLRLLNLSAPLVHGVAIKLFKNIELNNHSLRFKHREYKHLHAPYAIRLGMMHNLSMLLISFARSAANRLSEDDAMHDAIEYVCARSIFPRRPRPPLFAPLD